ncbi:3',5'-cyclic-nucleotide phosphodiesterase (3':5'-CNP) [Scheffersomyces xylosifermentans]|uniref:3',5'-cyclic-nucleotide phosphodiesterase (3':5'-CNP) n=1 Tax=Scheffersomyces xylosifermentans TaxID=1304137 RepID=UPI00315C6A6F
MSFEITFLGSSGGPLEGSTCAMLLKPYGIGYDDIISNNLQDELMCIDAGSGLASLTEIIYNEMNYKEPTSKLLKYYPDSLAIQSYYKTKITTPFQNLQVTSCFKASQDIFNSLNTYLITHPHLDHIASLVINSASFSKLKPKNIFGSIYTIDALQKNIFNGIIWPNMPSFDILNLNSRDYWKKFTVNNGKYTITMFDLSHGELMKHENTKNTKNGSVPHSLSACSKSSHQKQHYVSSAFLISHNPTNELVLIFGDFESDVISKLDNNLKIWRHIAPIITSSEKLLKGIVLECSNCNGLSEAELYGHLMPNHLIGELKALEKACLEASPGIEQPLKDLNIIVNHVKEPILRGSCAAPDDNVPDKDVIIVDPRQQILHDLNEKNESEKLGVHFSIGLNGVTIVL